ncbi:MAG: ketosamine-3-kinase [Chitinophagaceae bacterium]|nr:MAG: ketosamine-3-kinase [Chitinophagaceae bacterium]
MNVIDEIRKELILQLSAVLKRNVGGFKAKSVSGGSINSVYQLMLDNNEHLCCKVSTVHNYPDMFDAESAGLSLLASRGKIRVPGIIICTKINNYQVLVMEWIDQGPRTKAFWKNFGKQLSLLHLQNRTSFGLETDNYMGALPQSNKPHNDWSVFFYERRIQPQLKLAVERGLITTKQAGLFDRLPILLPDIFPDAQPCLLHGDLWSGNFLCDHTEHPVLIDPAVYYGHPAIDLAMTTLFGGFEQGFYEAYNFYNPFPANRLDQWDCCNLYPLLIHLNLFGRSYLGDILSIISRY